MRAANFPPSSDWTSASVTAFCGSSGGWACVGAGGVDAAGTGIGGVGPKRDATIWPSCFNCAWGTRGAPVAVNVLTSIAE